LRAAARSAAGHRRAICARPSAAVSGQDSAQRPLAVEVKDVALPERPQSAPLADVFEGEAGRPVGLENAPRGGKAAPWGAPPRRARVLEESNQALMKTCRLDASLGDGPAAYRPARSVGRPMPRAAVYAAQASRPEPAGAENTEAPWNHAGGGGSLPPAPFFKFEATNKLKSNQKTVMKIENKQRVVSPVPAEHFVLGNSYFIERKSRA